MIIPDPKKIVGGLLLHKPTHNGGLDEGTPMTPETQMDDEAKPLHLAAQDILSAIEKKSAGDLADALRAAFDLLDSDEAPSDG